MSASPFRAVLRRTNPSGPEIKEESTYRKSDKEDSDEDQPQQDEDMDDFERDMIIIDDD